MSLDVSKLNLRGIGTLKSNATYITGEDPGASYTISLSVIEESDFWYAEVQPDVNLSTILEGSVTVFQIIAKPGYHISASDFSQPDLSSSSYVSSLSYYDVAPQKVMVAVNLIAQDLTENVNIAINGIYNPEAYLSNSHHSIRINLTSFSDIVNTVITPKSGFTTIDNQVVGNIPLSTDAIEMCEVMLQIANPESYAFNWSPEIEIEINTNSLQENYSIQYDLYSESKIVFTVLYNKSESYGFNIQNLSDNINIDPYIITASIIASDTNIIIPPEGVNEYPARYKATHTTLEEVRAIDTATGNVANWITLSIDSSVKITFNVNQNPYGEDRSATVFLYNQLYQESVQPLASFLITQTDSPVLFLSGPWQISGSQSNPTETDVYDGIVHGGTSINNLKRSSSTIKYIATINSDLSWPDTVAELEENFVIFTGDNNSPVRSAGNSWLADNVSYNGLGTSELTIIFNIPENVESSPERTTYVNISNPHDAEVVEVFYIHQKRGFDVSLDNITLYLGDGSDLTTNSSGDYYNLPLYLDGYMYDIENTSKTFFAGIKLSQDNIDQGLETTDFIIEIIGKTYDGGIATEAANPDWCTLSYLSNNYIENESDYDNPRLSFYVQENLGDTRYLDINIYHPNNNQGLPLKTIHVEQQETIEAYFIDNSVEIINSGSVSVDFYCTSIPSWLSNTANGFTPVIALAGVKQFSYPENNTEPVYNNLNANSNASGNNIPVSVDDTLAGFTDFGITSAPTIVSAPGGSTSTGNGSITFNFEPTDQNHVFNFNSYRTWVYYIYPPNTVLSGTSVVVTNSNGLNSFSDKLTPQPSAILKIRQIPGVQQDLIGLNGVLMTKTPFDIDRVRTFEDGTFNPFTLFFNSGDGHFLLNANRLPADAITNSPLTTISNTFNSLSFPYGIQSSSDLLPINISNTGYNTSFTVNVSSFHDYYSHSENGNSSSYSLDLQSASQVSYNNITSIIGINNPNDLAVSIISGSIGQVSGPDPNNEYIYKLKFSLSSDGVIYYNYNEDVGQSQHNTHYSNDIPIPEVTYHTDGSLHENRYTQPFFNYIKIVSPPLPSRIGIHTPNLLAWHGTPQDMQSVEYFYKIQVGETVYPFSFKRAYSFHFVQSEDYAVFLLAGENNMVGMASDDGLYWPSYVYQ